MLLYLRFYVLAVSALLILFLSFQAFLKKKELFLGLALYVVPVIFYAVYS